MGRLANRLGMALLLALLLAVGAQGFETGPLRAFAASTSLADTEGFAETVIALRDRRKLPARYITKKEAEAAGWKPGGDLCRVAPGRAIGGDPFFNREKRLPERPGRRWYEADLDPQCGRRGARRLVWSTDGLIYITTDHYKTFTEVPR
jgi:ribonuclease T1